MNGVTTDESPLEHAVARVGDRWTLLIVDALAAGPRRFNDLLGALDGLASNILSQRLKRLEGDGVVASRPYSRKPLRQSYELTQTGRGLAGALRLLAQWGASLGGEGEPLRHAPCGTPLQAQWYCPTCAGTVDEAEGVEVRYV
jgi:DNA-binding HxlR family transcriptional regulator